VTSLKFVKHSGTAMIAELSAGRCDSAHPRPDQ
jgi:hypothetical protein